MSGAAWALVMVAFYAIGFVGGWGGAKWAATRAATECENDNHSFESIPGRCQCGAYSWGPLPSPVPVAGETHRQDTEQ